MPAPPGLAAALQAKKASMDKNSSNGPKKKSIHADKRSGLHEALAAKQQQANSQTNGHTTHNSPTPSSKPSTPVIPAGQDFVYDPTLSAFHFNHSNSNSSTQPHLIPDPHGNPNTDILIPLSPCVYRMTDYTLAKREPILLKHCLLKLGVLRCLQRECDNLNALLRHRLHKPTNHNNNNNNNQGSEAEEAFKWKSHTLEEEELNQTRFMELLSNCGIYQKTSELILQRVHQAADQVDAMMGVGECLPLHPDHNINNTNNDKTNETPNPCQIPQIKIQNLTTFLHSIETHTPALSLARTEITQTQTVSFYPGLGELFSPGTPLLCHPPHMEGSPLGCRVVQSWYVEEPNPATNITKRRFVLVVEFIVSVGEELVFVAASDVYPEFHDVHRNVPLKDLAHRRLDPDASSEDLLLLQRLQQRGEFYASISTKNYYLQYHPNSFYPMKGGGGWSHGANAVRPLSKGGRVMVDVQRGIYEGHFPIRGSTGGGTTAGDGMADTVKEAIKLFQQSKRTGVAVPFRTCHLPGFAEGRGSGSGRGRGKEKYNHKIPPMTTKKKKLQMGVLDAEVDSDRPQLWMAWPMVTGFSFTARVWGKLLLGMPKAVALPGGEEPSPVSSPARSRMGRSGGGGNLSGEGSCGNCGYIQFQEQAFEQLVLAEDKKELIRAVARNAGGGSKSQWDSDSDNDDDDDDSSTSYSSSEEEEEEEVALDVVANKGAASIFLLSGPPGCGKTLTAEAIAELLRKPLYIITAGDLGITASQVEQTLGAILELCQTWDALVLLDEADVFLEKRTCKEMERNALVCVMLRLLEYYSGCLFLSSNRGTEGLDEAIQSRITVMLKYPELDVGGRGKVWRNLVELVPVRPPSGSFSSSAVACQQEDEEKEKEKEVVKSRRRRNRRNLSRYREDFTKEDYEGLAKAFELNGRQIKNSIVLARALAKERGVILSMEILRRAVMAVAGEEAVVDAS